MNDSNRQNTESIQDIIKEIDKKQIVLPDFQRDFVWDESKTYELFDSLVRDIFIGSIIYGIPSFEIAVREIDMRSRKTKGKKREPLKTLFFTKEQINEKVKVGNFRAVLDGQQRITSIYRALKKIDNIWLILKNEDEFDQDKDFNEMTVEEMMFCFSGKQDSVRLSINVGDAFEMIENKMREKPLQEKYFDNLEFVKQLDVENVDYYFERFLIAVSKLQDLFKAEKMVSYFLLDMSSEKFALFFERSNSLGVRLDFIDILVAKLSSGFRLRTKLEELKMETGYNIEREILVREIAFLVSKNEGKSISIDKGYILSNLTCEHFQKYWENTCKLYINVLDFLFKNNFIMTQDWIPHSNMLIPLMIFLDNLPNKLFSQMNETQLEFVKYWYWGSIFAQRYTGGATNEIIILDSKILTLIAKEEKISNENYFRDFNMIIDHSGDLYNFTKKGSAVYKGVLTFINYVSGGLTDWKNGSKVSFNEKVDDHHIYPKAYLQEYISEEEDLVYIDCVVNRTLIPKITNIKIGKNPPDKYLNELYSNNDKLKESLRKHMIPIEIMDGDYNEFFSVFIEDRAKRIFESINEHIIRKKELIKECHYQERKKPIGNNIDIFARYNKITINAKFNRETQEVFLEGMKYNSVSTAANAAKKKISNKDTSTNGWNFWKYRDGEEEKSIIELRD
ncbi:GmrSD restriction endonuclease domain-containing protein [Clostridium chromiireducens]|uniref:GmrSD restriction endonuclease domain-containing protein n=1 Tax=Clostridium chromiireducens TaxID=225345 RepID=UPI003AF504F9